MTDLSGKVALISGAARGQGAAHALLLAENGADIVAVDVVHDLDTVPYSLATVAELDATVKAVEALGRRAVAVGCDVRDDEDLTAKVTAAVAELGRVDIVVATAGVCSGGLTWELTEDQWSAVLDTNLTGSWNLAAAALPHMIAQGDGGSIIFTGSHAAIMGMEYISHYAASKHALVGLTKGLALDVAEHGIRVNIVHPTSIDTPMFGYWESSTDTSATDPDERWKALNIMPIKMLEPREVSEVVLFFASDQSRMISGSAMSMGQRGS